MINSYLHNSTSSSNRTIVNPLGNDIVDTSTSTAEERTVESLEAETKMVELVIGIGLFLIMMGIGAACEAALFKKMARSPAALKAAGVGLGCQFIIMPILSFGMTLIFQVDGYTALGFILCGSMPGGTTSNVYTLWSQGVLELSVFMTVVSTFAAFGFTPLWLYVYGRWIDLETQVPLVEVAQTFAFLIIPLSLGMSLNWFTCVRRIKKTIVAVLSAFALVVFGAVIVMLLLLYWDVLVNDVNYQIYIPCLLMLPLSGSIGYGLCSLLGLEPALKRTVFIEVGLQNTALAFGIAQATIHTQEARDQTFPYPFLYALLGYVWGAVVIPVFRFQKRQNDKLGIVDNNKELQFVLDEDDDEEEEDEDEEEGPKEQGEDKKTKDHTTEEEEPDPTTMSTTHDISMNHPSEDIVNDNDFSA